MMSPQCQATSSLMEPDSHTRAPCSPICKLLLSSMAFLQLHCLAEDWTNSELWNVCHTKLTTLYQQFLSQIATNWITLQQQWHNFMLTQVHWCLLNLPSPYLSSKFCLNLTMYFSTQGAQNLHIKQSNTEHYWSIFQYQDALHYNRLPKDTCSLTIPSRFQSSNRLWHLSNLKVFSILFVSVHCLPL